MGRDLVQLARKDNGQLYVVSINNDVIPLKNFAPTIIFVDRFDLKEEIRNKIDNVLPYGANSYEIGESKTINNGKKYYAICPYEISSTLCEKAIGYLLRDKKELQLR